MADSIGLDFQLSQKLYGYSFNGGDTIIPSFVVLFLYVATVFSHIAIMELGTSWSSRAWESLGQLFVLALNPPPRLLRCWIIRELV